MKMKQEVLQKAVSYNEFIGDFFSNIEFDRYRNNFNIYWIKGIKKLIKKVDSILKQDLTQTERLFLENIKKLVKGKGEKNKIITVTFEEAKKLLSLSMEAMAERADNTKSLILDEKEEDLEFLEDKQVLFLLESSSNLLTNIKKKLSKEEMDREDFENVTGVSLILVKVYLYLLEEIEKKDLAGSMSHIKDIWIKYHNLSQVKVS